MPLPGLGATHSELAREAATTRWTKVHGHDVAYRQAGEGPLLVMIHGIAGSSGTWVPVMPLLAERYTVIAPDLLGHGESAKPRGDYSLGAYASGVRDLLGVLGHERATVVGHSLGGGVAMQFAYQFPQMAERLVLVCSGGLGKEVNPLLRALTVPGTEYVLPVVLRHELHDVARRRSGACSAGSGCGPTRSSSEVWSAWTRLTDVRAQRAFIHTIRAVIDIAGQRVSARDRLYLAHEVPTMIVWGDRDQVIPVEPRPHRPRADARQPPRDRRGRRPLPPDRAPRAGRPPPPRLPRHHQARQRQPQALARGPPAALAGAAAFDA